MELIRNCSHFSLIHVGIDLDSDRKPHQLVKISFNEEGAKQIQNEYDGIVWYCRQVGADADKNTAIFKHKNSYARLEVDFKEGRCGVSHLPLNRNFEKLHNAIDHYYTVFGKSGFKFQHSDYSVENIVFNGDEVGWILDWDNFNNRLPPEFDPLYCIMDACFFRYKRNRDRLSVEDVECAARLFCHVQSRFKIPKVFFNGPATYIRGILLKNKDTFGSQILKYPYINCSSEDLSRIDSYFTSTIRAKI